ncbi:AraC family transcriptional regulator [Pedobacter sp. ASV1-7]|uniref:helix-turn-helix domain-containing protein n=1 Tax=Pedobacter sp. ASV1-7 TaxID=3145237 RepID=UPI0032E886B3
MKNEKLPVMDIVKYKGLHPALKEFVESIFYMSRDVEEDGFFFQIALPNYECFLSFECDTDFVVRKGGDQVFSPLYTATVIPPQFVKTEIKGKNIKAIIVKFKDGGFYRLFKIPIPLFKNKCCNARDVFDYEFSMVYDQIMERPDPEKKIKVVEDFLLKKVINSKPFALLDLAAEKILLSQGNTPIVDLASNACMSVRQMQRKFMEQFGLSPKHYSKFVRYTNARQMKSSFPYLTWGEISLRCGYFDQMHLIHDFKSITGLTPFELFIHPINSNAFGEIQTQFKE